MCTGNTVKSTEGDDTSCPTVCDGIRYVPNSGHTACGKSVVNSRFFLQLTIVE